MSEAELILVKLKIVSETEERGMYLCDKEHSKILLDYITNLQTIEKEYCVVLSENAELEKNNQAMQEEMARTWEKLDKTYKIINEFESWLNNIPNYFMDRRSNNTGVYVQKGMQQMIDMCKNKLQELKGDSSNE